MNNIVLIGAGGTGISSLAYIFKQLGYKNIVCIDSAQSQITSQLVHVGFEVIIGHGIYHPQSGDLIIYSDAAIGSPELGEAKSSDLISCYSYHEFLGELSRYFTTISIAGTHGKSTTTAIMISTMIQLTDQVGLGFVGALVPQLDHKNFYINTSLLDPIRSIMDAIISGERDLIPSDLIKQYYLILEADEFNKHFLYYDTDYAIILNMQLDHSDVYANYKEYIAVFQQLCEQTHHHIIMSDDTNESAYLDHHLLQTYPLHHINLQYLFGAHNEHNSSLAYHLISTLLPDLAGQKIEDTIASFQGLRRRMEYLGHNSHQAMIYSDYGHHPDELAAVHQAFRSKYSTHQLCAVFQPHQLRRVMEFWSKFIDILKKFDHVIIYNIYVAREDLDTIKGLFHHPDFDHVTSVDELGELFAGSCGGTHITDFDDIQIYLTSLQSDQIGICFSAGDLDYSIRNTDIVQ